MTSYLFGDPGNLPHPLGAPARLGTGPTGETCKTCRHYTRVGHNNQTYLKCARMEKYWTHGEGTDIRAKWPACSEWEEKQEQTT